MKVEQYAEFNTKVLVISISISVFYRRAFPLE